MDKLCSKIKNKYILSVSGGLDYSKFFWCDAIDIDRSVNDLSSNKALKLFNSRHQSNFPNLYEVKKSLKNNQIKIAGHSFWESFINLLSSDSKIQNIKLVNSECESSLKNCGSLISHSFLHLPLSSLHTKDLINDIEQNKFYLNNEFKKLRVVNSSFCLPFGDINSFNDEVLEILSVSGYDTVYASMESSLVRKVFTLTSL